MCLYTQDRFRKSNDKLDLMKIDKISSLYRNIDNSEKRLITRAVALNFSVALDEILLFDQKPENMAVSDYCLFRRK